MVTHDDVLQWAVKTKTKIHKHGFIVLAPPGSGKTYFVKKHLREWVDADIIFNDLGLHSMEWHNATHTEKEEEKHYKKCDAALKVMQEVGLWVLGSTFIHTCFMRF